MRVNLVIFARKILIIEKQIFCLVIQIFKHCAKVLILFRSLGLETNNIYDEILWQRPLRTNTFLGNHHIYSSAHTSR